jgi:hypothetical protein
MKYFIQGGLTIILVAFIAGLLAKVLSFWFLLGWELL